MDDLLRRQWTALLEWLGSPEVLADAGRPSVLTGWTVGDLAAHTGRSFLALEQTVEEPDATPQTLRVYVSNYAAAADDIAEGTRLLAAELGDDLLDGLNALATRGFAALDRLRGPVVRGPRGPISRDDLVLTRLLELVVHGDDLARSLPDLPPPDLLDDAVEAVAAALAAAYAEVGGQVQGGPDDARGLEWVRAATGRVPSADPLLPLL